jgi:hypothetical protein
LSSPGHNGIPHESLEEISVIFFRNHATPATVAAERRRVLGMACLAHVVHDGYSSMLYMLLPFWQHEMALTLAETGILKTLYSAAMAAGQVPAGALGERRGQRLPLIVGTLLATGGAVLILHRAATPGVLGLVLLFGGLGASVQHPLASALIARAYGGPALRTVLGTYNFAGDHRQDGDPRPIGHPHRRVRLARCDGNGRGDRPLDRVAAARRPAARSAIG